MSMKKWTDEELITTRDNLDAWDKRRKSSGAGSKMWLLTALLGAFAISTGVAFIFLDGIDVMSVILIVMGAVTCFSWYRSDKQLKDNIGFLAEINKEIKARKLKDTSKSTNKMDEHIKEIKEDDKQESSVTESQVTDKK
jgi:Flp pilus assembly protein TadB